MFVSPSSLYLSLYFFTYIIQSNMEQTTSQPSFSFPAGISGFWGKKDAPPPTFAPTLFEERCQQTRALDFELASIAFANEKKQTYHVALLQKSNEQLLVFCNKYYPIVAFAIPESSLAPEHLPRIEPPHTYAEHEALAQLFNQEPFQVIPTPILRLEVDADNPETTAVVHQLYDAEFAEFAFWEPRSMGDVVFNRWG